MAEIINFITGLAASIGGKAINFVTGFVTGNAPVGIAGTNTVFLAMIFVMFVFFVKKAMGLVTNLLIIGVASALFPVILNYLGFSMALSFETILFFIVLGLAAFFIFTIGKYVIGLLGGFGSRKK
ncbi:MAG: hypothetical protein HZB65_04925 [Candidatus Aenigmarchaeota archaeon]|nr:hypothetical protein [Candidatus Aenigmarchaeota archaeon]